MASEEVESHIYKKFEILQKLGKGAYGIVWKAMDKKTKKIVALKKVFEAFHNATDAQRTFREVMILKDLSAHENIVKLLGVIKAENNKDIYLVFDFMETDLHAVIKAAILKKVHKQFIIYQLLKGLKYIHSGEVIHRDLKPANVLINSECQIKIADFGLARSLVTGSEDSEAIMTEYVATRWYRAPEIVLGSGRYSKAVDVWSVGCILAELVNGKALFPGVSTMNQVELILDVVGKPTRDDILAIESENAASIIQNITLKPRRAFGSFFKESSPETLDFLQRCLEFNPARRISIEEALNHPFVAQFRDPQKEISLSKPLKVPIDDNKKLSVKDYREALYDDIVSQKKEEKRVWRQKYLQQIGADPIFTKPKSAAPQFSRTLLVSDDPPTKPQLPKQIRPPLLSEKIIGNEAKPKPILQSQNPVNSPFATFKTLQARNSQGNIAPPVASKDPKKIEVRKTEGWPVPSKSLVSKFHYQKIFDQYQKTFAAKKE